MRPLVTHAGIAAPLVRINIDTDAIIPSREMKTVGKRGLADGLFAGWRYLDADARTPNPDFVLNRPPFDTASILLGGANFGCGSSREHAVWALAEYGFRVIIAPSYGAIFRQNCIRNGILPLVLDATHIDVLAAAIERDVNAARMSVDLPAGTLQAASGDHRFEIDAASRQMLIEGLDPIDITLRHAAQIEAHIAADRERRPWLYRRP